MGTLQNGLMGGFSGKVGPVVGATWRNKNIIRSAPQLSNKPRSQAQLSNQSNFGLVSTFLAKYRAFINAYFIPDADGKAAYGSAMSYHRKHATIKINGLYYMNYLKVLISKGPLPGVWNLTFTQGAINSFQLTWDDNSEQPLAAPNDLLTVATYAPALHTFYFFEACAERQDTSVQLTIPAGFTEQNLQLWATFTDQAKHPTAATSCYVGEVNG
ncbi:DUF6266 family protein [Marixanthomonas spongiae]|uniref:Uncharacterized protein n=1 Tax=Marixanthomonas spongiae TaxID=2174845 RepID=A0A2U0HVS4_9FLAO|nr:DUF6266 family protein [Marixanthomonas spongiae]PVW12850.1 hypothetical protein DDV96_14595 [Marixanthomonas spongiae]